MSHTVCLRDECDPRSVIPPDEARGLRHRRITYERDRPVRDELVNEGGLVVSACEYAYFKGGHRRRELDSAHALQGTRYEFEDGRSAAFDAAGRLVQPFPEVPLDRRVRVLPTITLTPGANGSVFRRCRGQEVHVRLPRADELPRLSRELTDTMRELGVRAPLAHGPDVDIVHRDFEPTMAWIRGAFGSSTITVHPARGNFGVVKGLCAEMKEAFGAMGVSIAWENLDTNDRWLVYPEQVGFLDQAYATLTLDISHLPPHTNLVQLVPKVIDRLSVVHLSNQAGARKHLPYREGELDVKGFLDALRYDGYSGYIVLEYGRGSGAEKDEDLRRLQDFFG